MVKSPIMMFTFGYAGWGNATPQLIQAANAIEQSRGFAPPVFVDVRIQRSVRAIGFSGSAFEKLLGTDRHQWMPELGNCQIQTRRGPMKIARPSHAKVLLDFAVERAREGQRVIFFCSCPFPPKPKKPRCHRYKVASLLHAAANLRNLSLQIAEWPGGEVEVLDINVSRGVLKAAMRSKAIVMGTRLPDPEQLALPWGSVANIHAGREYARIVTGPAQYRSNAWRLPVYETHYSDCHVRGALEEGARLRILWKLNCNSSETSVSEDGLSPFCVYTIVHRDKLNASLHSGGMGTFHEGRRWVAADNLLREAKTIGKRVPILLADASDCSRLTHWGLLTSVKINGQGTTYRVEGLKRLLNRQPQELYLRSTNRCISPNFIRPYAICITPDFISL